MRFRLTNSPVAVLVLLALTVASVFALGAAFTHIHAVMALSAVHMNAMGVQHMDMVTAGPALEIISGYVTAPSTTLTAWTMGAGDSLQVRNCDINKRVNLLSFWGDNQSAGSLRIRSPKMHDNTRGITVGVYPATVLPLMPFGLFQKLTPQDSLIVEQSGSATAGDIESGSFLNYYEDLPGVSARFISPKELMSRGVQVKPVVNTLALGTSGGYSGSVALNATEDLLKANTDYALIGYECDAECCTVAWRGADTGNLRVGGPGNPTQRHVTGNWFQRLSMAFDLSLIPVFNSANKSGITLDGIQDENGTDVVVNSILVELAPR